MSASRPDWQKVLDLVTLFAEGASSYTSDSRLVGRGVIFVALKGEKSDGHSYLPQVLSQMPFGVVVSTEYAMTQSESLAAFQKMGVKLLPVDTTATAHRALAYIFRRRFKGRVIAIGGSAGKTTTKDFVYTLVSQKYMAVKTEASQNGEAGIPKTLERLTAAFEVAVIEVGIDAPGDMTRHVEIVKPDMAVLTSIGPEHLNLLHSVDNVFAEEKILFDDTLTRGGLCFGPAEDEWLAKLRAAKGVTLVDETSLPPGFAFEQPVARRNGAVAVAVARAIGLTEVEIARGLAALSLPKGRGGQFRVHEQLQLIADHYNSNPASLREGLEFAAKLSKTRGESLHLVLGDMLDLGHATDLSHREILGFVRTLPVASALLVGSAMKTAWSIVAPGGDSRFRCVANTADAVAEGKNLAGLRGLILIKGSRGMALEKVIEAMAPGLLS